MKRALIILTLLCGCARGQILSPFFQAGAGGGVAAITLDNGGAPCSASGSTNYLSCSSAMTLSAGSTIVCGAYGQSGGNNETGVVMDSVNGFYENIYGAAHPNSTLSWLVIGVMTNSASGSITPQIYYSATPNAQANLLCYAFKGTATANVLDAGGVEQTASATVTNPTSGSSTAPLNANEAVAAFMSRNSSTAPSSGGGSWLPSGTLTIVGSSQVRQAAEYQIQTTATAVNGPFTGNSTSIATIDSQIALLQSGTTGGTRSMTGLFVPLGAPGSAPTGTMSAALLGAAGSTLSNIHFNSASPYWTLNGTAPTYDTSVNATGTRNIMVNQVAHTFGDAGSSMLVAGGTGTGFFSVQDDWSSHRRAILGRILL